MTVVHQGSSFRGGLAPLSMAIDLAERLHRLTFSDSDWNRIVRASLVAFGDWFIQERLALRFTDFARTSLGYDRKQHFDKNNVLAAAKADGTLQKICDKYFNGWNPWTNAKIPGPLWQRWLEQGWAQGKYKISVTGSFSGAKRDLRAYVKQQVRGELAGMYDDEKFQTPLVHEGALRDRALAESRATATATTGRQALRISIPQPHQTHPVVGATIRRITQPELEEGAHQMGMVMDRLINGAATRTVARGANAGQIRRALTTQQRGSIAHTIQAQRGGASRHQERKSIQ